MQSAPSHPEVVSHNITFWRNGFTIDDGPLRRFDDPANASFMEVILDAIICVILHNSTFISQFIMIWAIDMAEKCTIIMMLNAVLLNKFHQM